jgi:hypothetical protein
MEARGPVADLIVDLRDFSDKGKEFNLSLVFVDEETEVSYQLTLRSGGNHLLGALSQWLTLNRHRGAQVTFHPLSGPLRQELPGEVADTGVDDLPGNSSGEWR